MQTAFGEGGRISLSTRVQTTLRAAPLHNSCPLIWTVAEGVGRGVVKNLKKYKGQRDKKK